MTTPTLDPSAQTEENAATERLMVALRIRPLKSDERTKGGIKIAKAVDKQMVVLHDPYSDSADVLRQHRAHTRQYIFDCAFDDVSSQEEVYVRTTKPLVENVMNGYNATVFAYGATGSGKTYTMVGTAEQTGIMVRALNDLFEMAERGNREDTLSPYNVTMSYLEIYNETIRDLLNPSTGVLDLREDSKQGIQVTGLSEVSTVSTSEVLKMLVKGNKARTVEPTAANKTSSRSHALLQVNVKQTSHKEGGSAGHHVRTGKLYMIDLAGSERASQTQNRGKRLIEGAHINRSLLALGNCINALAEKGAKYVNFRDSKLTRLLKDALTGNCRTVMIAHISPASLHFEESRNTLAYADRAKNIRNKVKRNVMDVTYHVAQYQSIIEDLRKEITRLRTKIRDEPTSPDPESTVIGQPKCDNQHVKKLREELVSAFQEQMSLRHRLLEIDTQALSLSMEFEKYTMIINEWELNRAMSSRTHESKVSRDNKERETEKDDESEDDDYVIEPDHVKQSWDELLFIQAEQQRYLEERKVVLERFVEWKAHAEKLEEELPKISSEDQRELLSLLCKVHELEIDKTEMQAATLLKEHELRRKDLVILRYDRQRNLCDEIITRQRLLIDDNKVPCPSDLTELYRQYQQEMEELMQGRESHMKDLDDWITNPGSLRQGRTSEMERMGTGESHRSGRLPPLTGRDSDRFFVKRPRPFSKDVDSRMKRMDSTISRKTIIFNSVPSTPVTHTTEILTLPPIRTGDSAEKNEMRNGLKGITALVAKKKTLGSVDSVDSAKWRQQLSSVKEREEVKKPPRLVNRDSKSRLNVTQILHSRSDDNISSGNFSDLKGQPLVTRGSQIPIMNHKMDITPPRRRSLHDNAANKRTVRGTNGVTSAPNSPLGSAETVPKKPAPNQLPQHNLIFSM